MKQKLKEEIDKIDFFELAKQEKNPRKRIRLLAMGQVKRKKVRYEIAEMYQIILNLIRKKTLQVSNSLNFSHRFC